MSWIQTYTGKKFDPYNPDPEQIDLEDIAHALSNLCRFNGHCKEFYSIAQHSVLVSNYCKFENKLWGLLHDASEAYISDICSPIKHKINGYQELEAGIMAAICEKFNLPKVQPKEIKQYDQILLLMEKRDLFDIDLQWSPVEVMPLPEKIIPWPQKEVKGIFLTKVLAAIPFQSIG
jgi:hypothetical protein